jgi:hypothetical protein
VRCYYSVFCVVLCFVFSACLPNFSLPLLKLLYCTVPRLLKDVRTSQNHVHCSSKRYNVLYCILILYNMAIYIYILYTTIVCIYLQYLFIYDGLFCCLRNGRTLISQRGTFLLWHGTAVKENDISHWSREQERMNE